MSMNNGAANQLDVCLERKEVNHNIIYDGNIRVKKHVRRVFTGKTPLTIPKTRPLSSAKRTPHAVEGVLAVQWMLLQQLAASENTVKGFSGCSSQPSIPVSEVNLKPLKDDTCLAVGLTWKAGE